MRMDAGAAEVAGVGSLDWDFMHAMLSAVSKEIGMHGGCRCPGCAAALDAVDGALRVSMLSGRLAEGSC